MDNEDLIIKLLEAHRDRLDSIDESLREHMRRTDVLEDLHMDNQKRIEVLEEPAKARAYVVNFTLATGKLCGAILGVLAVLKALGKL